MSGTQQVETTRKAYRYRGWRRCVSGLFGAFFSVGGVALLLDAAFIHTAHNATTVAFAALPLSLGAYLLAVAFRPRIIIEGTRIDVRGALSERSATVSEIAGIRALPSRYGNVRQLVLKDGSSPITLRAGFKVDDDFRAWMQQIPDLDRRDREALLAEIQQREDLGATPEERLGALARARHKNIALLVVAAAAGGGFNFASAAWVRPCGVALALAPIVTAWLCWRWPLLFAVFKRRQDPRAETSYGLLIAAFGLLLHMGNFHFLTFRPLLPAMALLGVITLAGYYRAARSGYGNRVLVAIIFLAAIYAYGTVIMMDSCFDSSTGQHYSTTVLGRRVSRGRSTTYYLRLAPWGPVFMAQDVSVSSSLYHSTQRGDTVCLALHPGRLHAPWFRVASCSEAPLP